MQAPMITLFLLLFSGATAFAEPPAERPMRAERPQRPGAGGLLMRLDPERRQKLQEVRSQRPALHQELVRGSGMLANLREGDDRADELFGRIIDELHQLHQRLTTFEQATGREQQRARAAVAESVGRMFDLRQEARRLHLALLEERLAELRSEIDKREQQRTELVNAFTTRITTAPDGGF